MSSSGSPAPVSRIPSGPRDHRLVSWPLRDEAPGAWLQLAAAAGASVVAGWSAGGVATGLISFAFLAASLWRLWWPVGWELGPRGVTQVVWRRRRRIAWRQIGRCQVCVRGVLLSPAEGDGRASLLDGLYIPFAGRREELLAVVGYYTGAPQR